MAGQGYRWPLDAFGRLVSKCLSIAHRSKKGQKRHFWRKKSYRHYTRHSDSGNFVNWTKHSTVLRARERVSERASAAERAKSKQAARSIAIEWTVRVGKRVAQYYCPNFIRFQITVPGSNDRTNWGWHEQRQWWRRLLISHSILGQSILNPSPPHLTFSPNSYWPTWYHLCSFLCF